MPMPMAVQIKHVIEETADEWEPDRRYLGMSAIGRCPRELYFNLVDGRPTPNHGQLLRCHEGYLHEFDIVERLHRAGFTVTNIDRELVAPFDDRFRGHIDGEVLDGLLEIKSLNPRKFDLVHHMGPLAAHLDQVQAYMRYGGYERCLIVYKNRESGGIWCFEVTVNPAEGERIERKARDILAAVDAHKPPECTCGHCQK